MTTLGGAFPNLAAAGYVETSPASPAYNCIAWAAGRQDQCWWPDPNVVYFWPATLPRTETLAAFQQLFETLGYQICEEREWEAGFEKIALYALNGKPTHAARQLRDGLWSSKLGKHIDITHTLDGLEGPVYGQVAVLLKRSAQSEELSTP